VDNGGGSYSLTITPAGNGAVTVDISANTATDTAGNNNLIATQFSVQADLTQPTPVISGPSTTQTGAFSISVAFGEAVTGFALGDVSVGNGAPSALVDNGGGNFAVTVTPAADGPVTVDIAANIATDAASNNNLVATQYSVQANITGPTPQTTPNIGNVGAAFLLEIDFGEVVTGFDLGDFILVNADVSNLEDLGNGLYRVTITPIANGNVTVDVPGGAAQDVDGNPSNPMPQVSATFDGIPPAIIPTLSNYTSLFLAALLGFFGFRRKKNN